MVRIGILTASDKGASGARDDTSGDVIAGLAEDAGHQVAIRAIVADEREVIAGTLRQWCDDALCDVIMTTGGTGLTPRDVTPEATRDVAERDVPGIPMALALAGLQKTPYAALTRGIAVTRGKTLIVNLAGSPKAVEEGMDVLLPLLAHIADLLAGPVEHDGHKDGA
jgi:molybdenum cofactor synthesis domain-containing protein